MRPSLRRRTTVLLLPLTVTLHNGWCIVHKHTHTQIGTYCGHTHTHTRPCSAVACVCGCLYYVQLLLEWMCERRSDQLPTNKQESYSREQNMFILHGWGSFCNKLKNSLMWWLAWVSKCMNVCVCVCVCVWLGSFPSCIRINSLVYHVRLCLANRFPSRQARWTQMSSPEETFRGWECPCDTYREGHLTGKKKKKEAWVTTRNLAWLCHASATYSNRESAHEDKHTGLYTELKCTAATAWKLILSWYWDVKKCIYIMAGYPSYPSLLGINNPCLSEYVSPGDNTISSLLEMDGSRTYSTFRIA